MQSFAEYNLFHPHVLKFVRFLTWNNQGGQESQEQHLGKKSSIRILGLVKAMNVARQRLAAGIPPAEQAEFRTWIKDLLSQVETICRKNKLRPSQLPAPSYRAYRYLKGLDLKLLPATRAGEEPPERQVQIQGLIALCNQIQTRLSNLAQEGGQKLKAGLRGEARFKDLLTEIQSAVEHTQAICQAAQSTPGNLPAPSQRAYHWLKFLSREEILETHLSTLQCTYVLAGKLEKKENKANPEANRLLKIEFYNTRHLYRQKSHPGGATLTINEAFLGASSRILEMILKSVRSGDPNRYRQEIYQYAHSAEFSQISQALVPSVQQSNPQTRGRCFNLEDIFERVNNSYFESRILKPRLTWNETLTRRKLGHYDPHTDTVMVSISLDTSQTPEYVLDFVIYHELLHKQYGVKNVNGRRYAHTPAFRKAESKFKQYQQAQDYLGKLGVQGKL